MNHPIKLYRFRLSGHSHRVELFLSLLGVPFERIEVELGKGEHKTPAFLSLNRFGQVPVIEDRGYILADSNAILVYLAIAYDPERRWYPNDSVGARAATASWNGVVLKNTSTGVSSHHRRVCPSAAMRSRSASVMTTPGGSAASAVGASALGTNRLTSMSKEKNNTSSTICPLAFAT